METPTDPEAERKRIIRGRNRALALVLVAMVALFYFVSIARMS